MKQKVAVVRFPGSNCDLDAVQALRAISPGSADLVWHEDSSLQRYDAVVLPGGFSFGDYLRAGAIASRSPAIPRLQSMADSDIPILGICNGFQVLTEAGLLPGALLRNSTLRFVCRWVKVRVDSTSTPFTKGMRKGQVLDIPIAHSEGRYYAAPEELRRITKGGQVTFRYCDGTGKSTPESNPTGTAGNVAGLSNKKGNVVGLMPHPERASDPALNPFGTADGALILKAMLEAA